MCYIFLVIRSIFLDIIMGIMHMYSSDFLPIDKILVANRGEIAIRVARAATELGLKTVGIYAQEDRFALHRFKTDEAYLVGAGKGPLEAYLDMHDIIRIAKNVGAGAIHPGYGFLSENPDFADVCADNGILFVGPKSDTMRKFGNKVSARNIAIQAGVPVVPASAPLDVNDMDSIRQIAKNIGYPLMLKASWGGGGRGMRAIENESELEQNVCDASSEAQKAFGNGEVYFEKLIRNARHVEVQLMGDTFGNLVHLFERDCSIQRRNQKVVERAPAPYLEHSARMTLCDSALKLGHAVSYENAGTVEFLMDKDSGEFYFIEVNPRVQVEHTVTEVITGIDIVKSQILIACGAEIGTGDCPVPEQSQIQMYCHALQSRVTTENPENNFIPDYGRINAYRSATGFGIRLDGGTAYTGAQITPFYDSMLVKVTAYGSTPIDAIVRMKRALAEFRIRGVATNLPFLKQLLNHDKFMSCEYTTKFIDETPELFDFPKRRDTATRILTFMSEVMVNGNPEVAGRPPMDTGVLKTPVVPCYDTLEPIPQGTRDVFLQQGAEGFAKWVSNTSHPMIMDTTMRDAHQSLLATRLRTYDLEKISDFYAHKLPNLFSLECWGGATFDTAMRFLKECPWHRLEILREKMPNHMLQMLLRSSNAVGYQNYPDNAVQYFIERTADTGLDIFRVFDSLNWTENMKMSIDTVLKTGKVCEATLCYTGDLFDKTRDKFNLDYYIKMAQDLEKTGVHILAIKDMAGLLKPAQARELITALKSEISLPLHLHCHDTSGMAGATYYTAIEAGVDVVDCAMDSMSGTTSQPALGSVVKVLENTPYATGIDWDSVRHASTYWQQVRRLYGAFEADNRSGASEVYLHEMPGGQYTNLKQQARALGIGDDRWHLVAETYAQVNKMFGDIVKVTPSSKVVGDMAIMMVTSNLTPADVLDKDKEISFPESVVQLMRGDLGQNPQGFPKALQDKVLKGEKPLTKRYGDTVPAMDIEKTRDTIKKSLRHKVSDQDLASYIMYPKVFEEYAQHFKKYAQVSAIPTYSFFYGLIQGEEIEVEIEAGKTLIIKYLTTGDVDLEGYREVFFELNGQPRTIRIQDKNTTTGIKSHPRAEDGNPKHIPAPMPGMVVTLDVAVGQHIKRGEALLSLEAMKMQTAVTGEDDGVIKAIHVSPGDSVSAHDLLIELE